jgi:guanylate kinase
MKSVLAQPVGNLRQLPTATTRPMRPDEKQGREHQFVTHEEFQQMIAQDGLIEHQKLYGGDFYGVPRATVEAAIEANEDLIADIEVLGATYLRSVYPDNVILVFIAPASVDDLLERIQKRDTETDAEIASRMERVKMEMSYAPMCDYLIVNDDADTAAQMLRGTILAENSRRALLNLRVVSHLPRHPLALAASVLPCYGNEVLYATEEPHFPITLLAHGELPHEAALRALSQSLKITAGIERLSEGIANNGAFIPPVTVSSQECEHYQRITFMYHYYPEVQFAPPIGWAWFPRDHVI